jgi:hypothetical protein
VKRSRVRSCLVVAFSGAALVLFAAACGGDDPVVAGGDCTLATDCQPGLVCVPQGSKHVCSSDLSKVAGQVEADGGNKGTDGGDASTGDGGNVTPPKDSGTPDTGMGTPDSGAGPKDSGPDA